MRTRLLTRGLQQLGTDDVGKNWCLHPPAASPPRCPRRPSPDFSIALSPYRHVALSPCRLVALSPCRHVGRPESSAASLPSPTDRHVPPTHPHPHPHPPRPKPGELAVIVLPGVAASLLPVGEPHNDGRSGGFVQSYRIHRPTSSTTTTTASELLLTPVSAIKYYSRTLQRPETRSSPPPTAAAPSSLHFSWSNPFKFPRPFWALSTPEHAHVSR